MRCVKKPASFGGGCTVSHPQQGCCEHQSPQPLAGAGVGGGQRLAVLAVEQRALVFICVYLMTHNVEHL